MSYRTDLLAHHLAAYKQQTLGLSESGGWRDRSYAHILPEGQWQQNILPSIRSRYLAYHMTAGIRLHRDFNHLNSSQAFALNLFFPLLQSTTEDASLLIEGLGLEGKRLKSWKPEAVEDPNEGTNFDVRITLKDGTKLYIEVKLTEQEFGGVTPRESHRTKRNDIYLPRLRGKVKPHILDERTFFTQYQLLRNVSYAAPNESHVILLVPARNAVIRSAAEVFLASALDPAITDWVHLLFVEDLVSFLRGRPELSIPAKTALEQLVAKYDLVPGS